MSQNNSTCWLFTAIISIGICIATPYRLGILTDQRARKTTEIQSKLVWPKFGSVRFSSEGVLAEPEPEPQAQVQFSLIM